MLICIAVPNRDDFKGETVGTIARLTWDICGAGHNAGYISSHSCFIDKARNLLWEYAKQSNADYMLFLDSDIALTNEFNENIIDRLIKLNKDVVVGIYVDKKPPYRAHIYDFMINGKMVNRPEWPNEPFKIDAGPTGFMFISKKVMDAFTSEVIHRIGMPFSYMDYGKPTELGEDVSFCKRLKELGFEVWADPHLKLAHLGKEAFTTENYEMMKKQSSERFDNDIQGWMTPLELEFLYMKANTVKTVVEIGSWKGRSTKALLDSSCRKVYAVDTFKGSDDPQDLTHDMGKKEDIYEEFKKNVGHYEKLKIMRMTSEKAAKMFSDKSVDMVFIDANHTYEAVKKDIDLWKRVPKTILCGHDYAPGWPGVVQAVNEAFPDGVKTMGSIWYVEMLA